jgi:hypothetical protein
VSGDALITSHHEIPSGWYAVTTPKWLLFGEPGVVIEPIMNTTSSSSTATLVLAIVLLGRKRNSLGSEFEAKRWELQSLGLGLCRESFKMRMHYLYLREQSNFPVVPNHTTRILPGSDLLHFHNCFGEMNLPILLTDSISSTILEY